MDFMKKITVFIGIIILFLSGCKINAPQTVHSSDGFYFNTFVSVKLYGCGSDEIAREATELCGYYEKIFSRTLNTSLLYTSNEENGFDVDGSEAEHLNAIIGESVRYSELTKGGLDLTIEPLSDLWNFKERTEPPSIEEIEKARALVDYTKLDIGAQRIEFNGAKIDCGAVAKGYVADRIKEFLLEEGVDSAIINLGGNILCIGNKPLGEDFVIGVKKPYSEDVLLGLKINDLSVVTSGVYERYFESEGIKYHHILDPKTGKPCENGLLSVTIIAESSFECDALSTGCFVMGLDDAMELINGLDNVYGIFIDEDYKIYYTDGAEEFVN